ncbi:MAG: hypothetical protein ACYCZD_02585 [Rhodanobacter sp.]
MRLLFIAVLLLAPFAANAAPCQYAAPRHLQLDPGGSSHFSCHLFGSSYGPIQRQAR